MSTKESYMAGGQARQRVVEPAFARSTNKGEAVINVTVPSRGNRRKPGAVGRVQSSEMDHDRASAGKSKKKRWDGCFVGRPRGRAGEASR